MYLKKMKIKTEPFATTPDPRFLYLGDMHQKALERLTAAITRRRGITALIGEPGLGKSTLLRTMLTGMREQVNFAWVFNTTMEPLDLLRFICRDFGFTPKGDSKSDVLMELYSFFIREYEQNRIPLLIIDEAQNLNNDALEEIRQLSNLETVNRKLVQIILCGQPQLEEKLNQPDLVQLKQRISFKATLSRLSLTETAAYIQHRLRVAGSSAPALFSKEALMTIHEMSGGIPRLINQLCDDALHSAAQNSIPQVDARIIKELIDNGDVMRAPALPEKKVAPVVESEKQQATAPAKPKQRPQPQKKRMLHKRRIIQTEYDLFEAIDLAELLSVI
jgi:type II secretory pathway predicted ATPase ExeA